MVRLHGYGRGIMQSAAAFVLISLMNTATAGGASPLCALQCAETSEFHASPDYHASPEFHPSPAYLPTREFHPSPQYHAAPERDTPPPYQCNFPSAAFAPAIVLRPPLVVIAPPLPSKAKPQNRLPHPRSR